MRASPKQLFLNYIAVMSLLVIGYIFYTTVPHYASWFSSVHRLPGFKLDDKQILLGFVIGYGIVLIPFYATFDDRVVTKSRRVWNALLKFPSSSTSTQTGLAR